MIPTQTQIEEFVLNLKALTQREVIRIELSLADALAFTDSKFGGVPYIPKGGALPRSAEGKPLFMLAQINCEQLPENNLYPKKGLLQFWIAATDDYLYGIDFDNPCSNDNKRVLYYPTIGETLPAEAFAEHYTFEDCYLPFDADLQFALRFTKGTESFTLYDEASQRFFIEKWNSTFDDEVGEIWDLPEDVFKLLDKAIGHKIGGYPYFTQYDPRKEGDSHTFLLLQIDSDEVEGKEILWGDCGVANFFISTEDMANCNFDDVLYNWDCS